MRGAQVQQACLLVAPSGKQRVTSSHSRACCTLLRALRRAEQLGSSCVALWQLSAESCVHRKAAKCLSTVQKLFEAVSGA